MKITHTLPDGRVIEYNGDLNEKKRVLALNGVDYTFTAEEQARLDTIATFKAGFQAAIDRLQQIENSGTIPFTQAGFNQVVQAVKDMAKYERLIAQAIRYLALG